MLVSVVVLIHIYNIQINQRGFGVLGGVVNNLAANKVVNFGDNACNSCAIPMIILGMCWPSFALGLFSDMINILTQFTTIKKKLNVIKYKIIYYI